MEREVAVAKVRGSIQSPLSQSLSKTVLSYFLSFNTYKICQTPILRSGTQRLRPNKLIGLAGQKKIAKQEQQTRSYDRKQSIVRRVRLNVLRY